MDNQVDRVINEARKRAVVEKAILQMYNDKLLEEQLITAEQHQRMRHQVALRRPTKQWN